MRLRPYRKGCGPSFSLIVSSTGRTDRRGCSRLAYRLLAHDAGRTREIFAGDDYSPSPMHADDSDASIAGLLGFLTLRPGDTDPEYFADYTAPQLEFAQQHAETLACETIARFGEC